jgi:hypothetical protein
VQKAIQIPAMPFMKIVFPASKPCCLALQYVLGGTIGINGTGGICSIAAWLRYAIIKVGKHLRMEESA